MYYMWQIGVAWGLHRMTTFKLLMSLSLSSISADSANAATLTAIPFNVREQKNNYVMQIMYDTKKLNLPRAFAATALSIHFPLT
jgi:hypothetical protein